jgi:hypothetical protein
MHNWGTGFTIITSFDKGFFPGFCALYNSARSNGYKGTFLALNPDKIHNDFDTSVFKQTEFKQLESINEKYSHYVNWLTGLKNLPDGNYLYLDCDTIIERPLGFHLELINEAPIVSTEYNRKYDLFDVLTARQCIETGLSTNLKPFPYINDGFFAFQLPRDQKIIDLWVNLSLNHLTGINEATDDPRWYFLEQDVLNIILRQPGQEVFSISPNHIEIDDIDKCLKNRRFPWTKQTNIKPKDKLKFVIHGAGLRRPWIISGNNVKRIFELNGILPLQRRIRRKICPYERAWFHYTFNQDVEVNANLWIEQILQRKKINIFWKMAYQ